MPVSATQTAGLTDTWGGKIVEPVDWTGPASYVNGVGELLPPNAFGCPNNLLFAWSTVSVSGTYFGLCRPNAVGGYTSWYVQWFVSATGAEVGNAVSLSAEKIKVLGMGV